MKSILLHIGDDAAFESRLQVALDLARSSGGHLTCLQAVSYEVAVAGDFYGSAAAAAMPVIREAAEKVAEEVKKKLAGEDVSWDWIFERGMAEHELLHHSPLHDVIVVGPSDIDGPEHRPSRMVGDLVLQSKTPVLVVPRSSGGFDASKPVLVGWNGSPEACHAVRAARTLLMQSEIVYLATIREKSDESDFDFPPTEGAEYLARYGIRCEIVSISEGTSHPADTLSLAAKARGCGYMVMGAYGRSRLAETLFGGVTRRMLQSPELPLLMAH